MTDSKMYMQILIDSLKKKIVVLNQLICFTKDQEEEIQKDLFTSEKFESIMKEKEQVLNRLSLIEEGFDLVFNNIKDELYTNKYLYQHEIGIMQALITEITHKGIELKSLENSNKLKLELCINQKRKRVCQFNKGSKLNLNYYKSMEEFKNIDGLFLDRKR